MCCFNVKREVKNLDQSKKWVDPFAKIPPHWEGISLTKRVDFEDFHS